MAGKEKTWLLLTRNFYSDFICFIPFLWTMFHTGICSQILFWINISFFHRKRLYKDCHSDTPVVLIYLPYCIPISSWDIRISWLVACFLSATYYLPVSNVVFKQSKKLRFVRFINFFTIFKNICQRELFLWYHRYISFRGVIYGF